MDTKIIIKVGRIIAIICLLVYSALVSAFGYELSDTIPKFILLAAAIILIVISVIGLWDKYKKQ